MFSREKNIDTETSYSQQARQQIQWLDGLCIIPPVIGVTNGATGLQLIIPQVARERRNQELHIDFMYLDALDAETEIHIVPLVIIARHLNILYVMFYGTQQKAIQ